MKFICWHPLTFSSYIVGTDTIGLQLSYLHTCLQEHEAIPITSVSATFHSQSQA